MLTFHWSECEMVQLLWNAVGPLKLNIYLPCDPARPLLGICPKKPKTHVDKIHYKNGYSNVILKSQKLETAHISIKRTDKLWHTMNCYSTRRRNKLPDVG